MHSSSEKELKRFKEDASYRVLLMSVQSGGVGLNITQANWMLGLDRWFNPQVHDQAESRCHRIGQTKPVNVSYLDASCTIDDVMKKINQLKEANADLVLADGKSIGIGSTINYYQLVNGILGELVKSFQQLRLSMIAENAVHGDPDAPLVFNGSEEDLERKLQEMRRRSMTAIKNEESSDEDDGDDAEDNRSSTDSMLSISHAADSKPKSKKSPSSRSLGLDFASDEDKDDSDDDELFSDSKLMFPSALSKTDKQGAKLKGDGNAKSSPSPKGINDVIELLSDDDEMSTDEDFGPSPTKQRAMLVGKVPPASLSSKDQSMNGDGGNEQPTSSASGEGGKAIDSSIHEMTEEEQLQAAIRASMLGHQADDDEEDKENGGGSTEVNTAPTNDHGNENIQEDESKPPVQVFEREIMSLVVGDEPVSGAEKVARVQIRMPDGKRIVRKFDGGESVKLIFAFVAQSTEADGKPFALRAGFPPKDLFANRNDPISAFDGDAISVIWK